MNIDGIIYNGVEYSIGRDTDIGVFVENDNSAANLNIGDYLGNVLCEFKEGHIRTKNFDSRNIANAQVLQSVYDYVFKFRDKSIVFLGDSITAIAINWTQEFLRQIPFHSSRNYAVSGATFQGSGQNTIYTQMNNLISDIENEIIGKPDYIIIAAGTNDAGSGGGTEPPTIPDTYKIFETDRGVNYYTDSGYSPSNFYTTMKWILDAVITKMSGTKVIICTPMQTADNIMVYNRANVLQKHAAELAGFNVIVQSECVGITACEEYRNHVYLYDGVHPNAAGAALEGKTIASKFKSFFG